MKHQYQENRLCGIEIPNKEKEIVALRDIIESNEFKNAKSKISFALGKNAAGEPEVYDIAKMPHVLIAGSTGSRKECLYKYINNKYNIQIKTKWSKTCYGRSKSCRTFCI